MKIIYIVPKIDEEKNLAIWYYGKGKIAEILYKSRKISIVAPNVVFLKDDDRKQIRNKRALKKIVSDNYISDSQLYEHNKNHWNLDWFGEFDFIYENMQNGSTEMLGNDECYSYTDAVKFAKSKILDNNFWIDTNKLIKKVTTINANENWVKYIINEEKFTFPIKIK